jgi:hypothetical protein
VELDHTNHETLMPEAFPSVYQETLLMHEYADAEKFTRFNLLARQTHFLRLGNSGELSARAECDIEIINRGLKFEIASRISDDFRATASES